MYRLKGFSLSKSVKILDLVFFHCTVFILPAIFLFNLYNRNFIENHLPFFHTTVTAVIMGSVSIILFTLFRFISRSLERAFLILLFFGIAFWLFEQIYYFLINYILVTRGILFIFIILGISIFIILLRRYEINFNRIKTTFRILAACICLMFLLDFWPAIKHEVTFIKARELEYIGIFEQSLNRDFVIDPFFPKPDIFWLHMDGMMSHSMFEYLFGICQDHFRNELINRGFVIYEYAILNAGGTQPALSFLLSPTLFDIYYDTRFQNSSMADPLWLPSLHSRLSAEGLDIHTDVFPQFELTRALSSMGYEIAVIGGASSTVRSFPYDRHFNISTEQVNIKNHW